MPSKCDEKGKKLSILKAIEPNEREQNIKEGHSIKLTYVIAFKETSDLHTWSGQKSLKLTQQ